jgi:DeoR/GlpR family transcriptional regulator of sugar metabolism
LHQEIKLKRKHKYHSYLPAERQQRIVGILEKKFSTRSSKLSKLLGVSEMTIRRDLDALEQSGLVERTHGGAVFRQERIAGNFHYQNSKKENPEQKKRIAQKAAAMIEPHDTVYIGEGTTASMLVRFVDAALPFTLFTNNLGVISELASMRMTAELVLLPGTYNPTTHALAGPLTMEMIRQVNATKVFIGADGLSIRAGVSTADLEIATIERSMIQQTRGQVIVMADHPKFGLVAEISIVPLKHIDVLITNRKIPSDFQKNLDKIGVRVVIAS